MDMEFAMTYRQRLNLMLTIFYATLVIIFTVLEAPWWVILTAAIFSIIFASLFVIDSTGEMK